MFTSPFTKTYLPRFLTTLLLVVLLLSCGTQNQVSTFLTPTPTSNSINHKSNPSNNLSSNKNNVSINKGGLHIDAFGGIQCPSGEQLIGLPDNPNPPGLPLTLGNNLVLATNRLTYNSNEIQQMKDYLKAPISDDGLHLRPPSVTLRFLLGGPTGALAISNFGGSFEYVGDCSLTYLITNTTHDIFQIASAGVQLTTYPLLNTYQYRLIDECNILGKDCPNTGGGGSGCGGYTAIIKLNATSANSVFSAQPVGYDKSCGELTLKPGDTDVLVVYFYSPKNFIYSAVPQLTLDTSSGQKILTLSELTGTLAFANNNQFTCYGLKGNTFVAETTIPLYGRCI